MSLADKLRKTINDWLGGGNADALINRTISSEMAKAIEEVRPEITEICKSAVKKAVDDLKSEGVLFDKDRLSKILNDTFEYAMDTYDDEIKETLYEQLITELKASKIFGR